MPPAHRAPALPARELGQPPGPAEQSQCAAGHRLQDQTADRVGPATHAAGIPLGTVLIDAGYGYDSQFREGVTELELLYAAGIQSNVLMWKPDALLAVQGPNGEKPSRPQLRAQQISAKQLALSLPAEVWQMISWRENDEGFTSRFARLRTRPVTRRATGR